MQGGVCAAMLLGCGHTERVKAPERTTTSSKEAPEPGREGGRTEESKASSPEQGERSQPPSEPRVPLAASPGALMQKEAVMALQKSLKSAGFLEGPEQSLSGRLDAKTEQALRAYQRAHDLPATGLPDRATAASLGLDPEQLFKSAPTDE